MFWTFTRRKILCGSWEFCITLKSCKDRLVKAPLRKSKIGKSTWRIKPTSRPKRMNNSNKLTIKYRLLRSINKLNPYRNINIIRKGYFRLYLKKYNNFNPNFNKKCPLPGTWPTLMCLTSSHRKKSIQGPGSTLHPSHQRTTSRNIRQSIHLPPVPTRKLGSRLFSWNLARGFKSSIANPWKNQRRLTLNKSRRNLSKLRTLCWE